MVARFLTFSRRWVAFLCRPMLKRNFKVLICCVGFAIAAVLAPFGVARIKPPSDVLAGRKTDPGRESPQDGLRSPEEAVASMLQDRFQALVDGNVDRIKGNYDENSDAGLWSWEKESSRVSYLQAWASARGVKVTEAKARIEIDSVTPEGSNTAWVEVTEQATYVYRPASETKGSDGTADDWAHTFGSRAVHVIEIVRDGRDWKIRRDWYADPIGQESYLPPCEYEPGEKPGAQVLAGPVSETGNTDGQVQDFDRKTALEYAVRYAGVPAIEGSGKYNSKFRVYTFIGGDCANFASQVLEAGGLPQGYGWHYTSEGSAAWVRGEDLVWHLLATGRAKRLYAGEFAGAVERTAEYPGGYVSALEPGDIIAYETKGQISHVAVVTGKDLAGYVNIASHTSDRLYFPWDIGWNDSTEFWLIKIVY